jgi:hypothetical protein
VGIIFSERWNGVTAPAPRSGWDSPGTIVTTTSCATPLSSPNMIVAPTGGAEIITYAMLDGHAGNVRVQGRGQFGTGGGSHNSWFSVITRGHSSSLSHGSSTWSHRDQGIRHSHGADFVGESASTSIRSQLSVVAQRFWGATVFSGVGGWAQSKSEGQAHLSDLEREDQCSTACGSLAGSGTCHQLDS